MGPENIEEFGLAARGADALTPFLDKEAEALRGITGEQIAAALGGLISGADAAVLTGEFADDLAEGLPAPSATASRAGATTTSRSSADWGFPLDALAGGRRSGRATRTTWSRSRTASGSRRTFPVRAPTWSRVPGTSR